MNETASTVDVFEDISKRDVQTALHDELRRLPPRRRDVLTLFYLEGKSREQVSLEMDCSEAVIKGLLARGRSQLRARLLRRGVALSVAMAGVQTTMSASASAASSNLTSTLIAALANAGQASAGLVKLSTTVSTLTRWEITPALSSLLARSSVALAVALCFCATPLWLAAQVVVPPEVLVPQTATPSVAARDGRLDDLTILLARVGDASQGNDSPAKNAPEQRRLQHAVELAAAAFKRPAESQATQIRGQTPRLLQKTLTQNQKAKIQEAEQWLTQLGAELQRDNLDDATDGAVFYVKIDGVNFNGRQESKLVQCLNELTELYQLDLKNCRFPGQAFALSNFKSLEHLDLTNSSVTDAAVGRLRNLPKLESLRLDGTSVTDAGAAHFQTFAKLKWLRLTDTAVTDRATPHLANCDSLQYVYLKDTQVTDEGLKHLKPLKQLALLDLGGTQVSDQGVVYLDEFKELFWLSLNGSQVSDEGVKHLAKHQNLMELYLCDTQVTDAGISALNKLPRLKRLDLDDTRVSDVGIKHLRGMPLLSFLSLNRTKISDTGLKHLRSLKSLHRAVKSRWQNRHCLKLNHTEVTDAGLAQLTGLQGLCILELDGTRVTDAGLERLAPLPNLHTFSLRETQVSTRGLTKFQAAHPFCKIFK